MAIESDHIGWHENEKKRRRNRWLIQVSFLVPIKHIHRNILVIYSIRVYYNSLISTTVHTVVSIEY